jgi:hypothetical protein
MKTYTVGMVAVAILVVVTCIGFGIAQAGGTHSDHPVLSFEDQDAPNRQFFKPLCSGTPECDRCDSGR